MQKTSVLNREEIRSLHKINHLVITQNDAYPLALSSNLHEQAQLHRQKHSNPFTSPWSSWNLWAKKLLCRPGVSQGTEKFQFWTGKSIMLRVMIQTSCSYLCLQRQKWTRDTHITTLAAACVFWLNRHFPYNDTGNTEAQSTYQLTANTMTTLAVDFYLIEQFGIYLSDLLLHIRKTPFIFSPLILTPSNTYMHISMDLFGMHVCKIALHFQHYSHQILGGI